MLECVVPKQSGSDNQAEVKVSFGGHKKTSPDLYTYSNDPTITMIEPKKSILRLVLQSERICQIVVFGDDGGGVEGGGGGVVVVCY